MYDAHPRMTTEILRIATPGSASWWGIERSPDGGTSWGRLSHKIDPTQPGQPPKMWSCDELSCETIHERWGDGLYRLCFYNHRRKQPVARSKPFIIETANEPEPVHEPAPPKPNGASNGHSNGRSNGHAATSVHDQVEIMRARAVLPMELFSTIYSMVSSAEERRERQFHELMQFQIEQVKAAASVDIARAEAATKAEIARVEAHTNARLESEREFTDRLQDALEARSEGSGVSDELRATLEALRARIEQIASEEGEEQRSFAEELILSVVDHGTPAVLNAIAQKMGIQLPAATPPVLDVGEE